MQYGGFRGPKGNTKQTVQKLELQRPQVPDAWSKECRSHAPRRNSTGALSFSRRPNIKVLYRQFPRRSYDSRPEMWAGGET
ncbi:MAG: hypothetical protein NVS1B12_01590 [Acidimicrobiales bacterium]